MYSIVQHSTVPLVTLVISGILGVIASSLPGASSFGQILAVVSLLLVGLAIVIEVIAAIVAKLEYSVSKIMLDDTSLRVVSGIFNKEEVAIPFRRIESVEIKQGMLHQMMHVGHVVVSTITDFEMPGQKENESDEEVVPIMDYDLSKAVADALTSRAEVERMHVEGASNIAK